MTGKRDRINDKLKNPQNTTVHRETKRDKPVTPERGGDDKTPSKYRGNLNQESVKESRAREDDNTPKKPKTKQETNVTEFCDDQEDIDSSIEVGMSKSKKHVRKIMIQDADDEEDPSSFSKFGIKTTGLDEDLEEIDPNSCTVTGNIFRFSFFVENSFICRKAQIGNVTWVVLR
jgi:hypothetical protein